jgi:aspartate racemase
MAKHIGLIGGIGPASTEFYYRALVRLYAAAGQRLALTIANADARDMVGNLEAGAAVAQAEIFGRYVDQLRAGGCEAVALTSMGGHFCIKELTAVSSLPVISAIPALELHFSTAGLRRVGVLGTRAVMESGLYGISSVEVMAPAPEDLSTVHETYIAIAMAGAASDDQRRFFRAAGAKLRDRGAEVIVLGGTDLFLAFDEEDHGYPIADCGLIHAAAIARVGLAA